MRRINKCFIIPISVVLVLLLILFAWKSDVFGKFVSVEPYVMQDADGIDVNPENAQVITTSEGSNQKGKDGSGIQVCSEDVPTCVGKKGTPSNPFVVLEIVPSHEQQQLCYFAGNEESGLPFNPVEFSRKVLPKGESYVSGKSINALGIPHKTQVQWLTNTTYATYKIGSESETKDEHIAEIGKYYTVQFTSDQLQMEAEYEGKNPQQELEKFTNIYNNGSGDMKDLAEQFPYMFEEDSLEKDLLIEPEALRDNINWKKTCEKEGYLIVVDKGTGSFDFDGWNLSEGTQKKWIFSDKKPETGKDLLNEMGVKDYELKINWADNNDYSGNYVCLKDFPYLSYNGLFEPKCVYKFEYYGLKFNDILKRSLFSFTSQKDYENFHMKVICMTPKELNQITKKDTDDTIDMIERADMYFIQTGYMNTVGGIDEILGTKELYNMYHKWVKKEEDYEYNKERDALTFFDSDLEWSSVMKIIKRVSENKNLPLLFNKPIGTMLNVGVTQKGKDDVCMYVTSQLTHLEKTSCINNVAKLFMICTQFDLLARTAHGYTETFMENIYPNLQQIPLKKENVNTAKMTGYYKRKEAIGCDKELHNEYNYKNRVNYLWNPCTFYPETIPWSHNLFQKGAEDTKMFVQYGFHESYITDLNSNPFINPLSQQVSGATVKDEDKNVSVIGLATADTNESTLLHPNRSNDSIGTNYLSIIAHTILNAQAEHVEDMTVSVLRQKKEYTKISDTAVLLDYSSDLTYGDEKSYIKVNINANLNNMPGVVKKVVLTNGEKEKTLCLYSTKEFTNSNLCEKQTYHDDNKTVSGYVVDGSLVAYIPYSIKDWANQYTTMQITTVGRIYSKKKKKYIAGEDVVSDITIGERTLFNLE